MNENEKNTNLGELISEEQLDAVSGGATGHTALDPIQSETCWFDPDGGPREDGRTRCQTECKGIFKDGGSKNVPVGSYEGQWYSCRCWGSNNCIDKWHKPCGHTNRW